jgi:hypothetical protein
MDFLKLIVGEKFEHDIPDEGMSIILANGMPLLVFNFTVSARDISNFLNGAVSFGLFAEQNVMFFLFKIERFLDWSDLAFTIHLAGDERVTAGNGYLPFNLVLVEPGSQIVKGLRMVTVSPEFRTNIVRQTEQQAAERFDTVAYYQKIGRLYQNYPSAIDMLKKALIVEQGGTTLPKQ